MIEKRFQYAYDEYNGKLFDNKYDIFYHIEDTEGNIAFLCENLNNLYEENERLKQELKIKYIINKQYEEIQRLTKMLNNITNHMQKEHQDMPIDDFAEWWNNIATEGLDV